MGKHLKEFQTLAEYKDFKNSPDYIEPNTSWVVENTTVYHNYDKYEDEVKNEEDEKKSKFSSEYMFFEAIEDCRFWLTDTENRFQYSFDKSEWVYLPHDAATPKVAAGDKIYIKCFGPLVSGDEGIGQFESSGKFNVKGNIMSLLYGDDFADKTDLTGENFVFSALFSNNTNLISAEELVLPAEKLSVGCYQSMFKGCIKLLTAPSLPAVTLAKYCYSNMFQNCFELSNVPELPVTTLESNCYMNMFNGCASIVASPLLPASVLVESCYSGMFYNCSSLKEITMLATDNNANDCLTYWVYGVASEGIFYRNPEMDMLESGVDGIPEGWTLVPGYQKPNDDESDLEADTTLNEYFSFDAIEDGTFSFSQNDIMYNLNGNGWNVLSAGKTTPLVSAGSRIYFKATNPKITNVEHEVPLGTISAKGGIGRFSATGKFNVRGNIMSLLYGDEFMGNIDLTDKNDVFYALFYNCTKIVNANNLILPATTMSVYGYQAMFMGCSSLLTAPELPATTLADHCYESMFWGCSRLLETPVLPATTVAVKCYQYMFRECTAIKKACDLPAVTLEDSCYEYMFYGCSNLEVAPVISATKLAYQCCWYMFAQCKSLKSAPALLSETLVSYSYASMFAGCSNLNEIKMYATNASAYNCLSGWVSGVASEGTFYRNPEMKSLSRGSNGIPQGWTLIPGDEGEMDDKDIAPIDNYFTLEAIEDCVFSFNTDVNVLQYSFNRKEWNNLTVGASTPTVNAGSKIYFKATNPSITEEYGMGTFCSTGKFSASGNIMSLWYAENFAGKTVLEADYVFKKLFATNKGITDTSNLVLPATTLSQGCYQNMFDNCENLVNVPELPATTLANRCYDSMFKGCVSLVNAPKLHANRLADACYYYMFANCPNLIDAPELPATILANDCYCGMFYDCISLVNAPKLPSISLMDKCYNNMFNGCVNLIKAPVLSASVLKNNCYENMFSGCSNLNEITMLATDASAYKCLSEWVSGVASEGTFYRSPEMDSLPRGINGIPAGWTLIPGEEDVLGNYFTFIPLEEGSFSITNTTNNIYYKIGANKWILLPPDTPTPLVSVGDKISFKMTNPVISKETGIGVFKATGRFDVNGNIMSLLYGDDFVDKTSMGNNTTVFACLFKNNAYLINASNLVLPATSLTQSCYKSMFNGCTNLVSTPELPATKIPKHSYWSMFEGCTSLITTPELPATSLGDRCYQNMFFGCTNLISVPELPATNMVPYCYHCMFQNCTSLTVLPALPATTLQKGCYSGIFAGCTSLIDASSLVLPAKKMVAFCYENMFDRCTNLISTPELPATTLASYCYSGMFNRCTNLTSAPELPATTLSSYCYYLMFQDCSNLNEIRMMATNISANDCLDKWVEGVASEGTFYRNPEMASLPTGVNGIPEGWTIIPPYDEKEDNDIVGYLTFEAIENGTFSFAKNNIYYSLDEKVWHRLLSDASTPTVSAGSKIYFKATNPSVSNIYGIGTFSSTGRFNVSGNVMSMLYGDDFIGKTDLTYKDCVFRNLFGNCDGLVDASELILPATTLASNCYQSMFQGCTSLTTAPELPVTTLKDYCYRHMFDGCTSLATAPALPAATLAEGCYTYMFQGCTSLTTAPELPATTLAEYCYSYMFKGCTSLTTAPALPATTLAKYCYQYMFRGCTSLTTAPELPATTLATYCYQYMFSGCENLTTAPELPATTLTQNCYKHMFYGCSNLNEITMLATDVSASDCLDNWVEGVASEGTFYRNPEMASLPIGVNGIPEGWTIIPPYDEIVGHLTFEAIEDGTFSFTKNSIYYSLDNSGSWTRLPVGTSTPTVSAGSKIYFKATNPSVSNIYGIGTFSSTGRFNVSGNVMSMLYGDGFVGKTDLTGKDYAFEQLFYNCDGLVDASELILPATILSKWCYRYMFLSCTNLKYAPALPATTLAEKCYGGMFEGCSSLAIAPKLPATTLANECYVAMFEHCIRLTSAPELPATTLVYHCYEYMFLGCYNLRQIKMYATGISAGSISVSECLALWVDGVASEGTFYRNPEMKSLPTGRGGIPKGWTIIPPYDANEYLTFEAIEDATFSFTQNAIQYSVDGTKWNDLAIDTSTPTVSAGSKIHFKATNPSITSSAGIGTFSSTGRFNVSGNVMSMLYGDDFVKKTNLTGKNSAFGYLFKNCTKLVNASELNLPATTLVDGCYKSMFYGCTSLVTAPELPATTLAEFCYTNMFRGCTSLVSAPELPATTLANDCYEYMFFGCTSLTGAPELPATTLASWCYRDMFSGCTSLTSAPELPATTLKEYCYTHMFDGCSNLNEIRMMATNISASSCLDYWVEGVASEGTFYRNPEMTSLPTGVNGIPEGWTIIPPYDDIVGHLTFEAIEDGTFSFTKNNIYYSLDNSGSWTRLSAGSSTPTVSAGSKIHFKATNPSITSSNGMGTFSSTGRFNAFGNIMSMLYGDDFIGKTDLVNKGYAFFGLFCDCTGLVDASELILPATTLAMHCYESMFNGCTSLTSAPALPATTLAQDCYDSMFWGCTNLTTAPALPATTLAHKCYSNMFEGCTGLVSAPALPATKLAAYCYYQMFWGCTSLVTAPELPATTLIDFCYNQMFVDCTSLTTAPALSSMVLANNCYQSMFDGCTSLVNAPALPATTLAVGCYSGMFKGCTSLTSAPELPAATLVQTCYGSMFWGCTSLTTAPALPTTTLAERCYQEMFYDCASLTSAPALPATTLAERCYYGMFTGCFNITTAPELPATTLAKDCYTGMFAYCVNLASAPELPATTLAQGCYTAMFSRCSKLNNITMLATDISAADCLSGWVYDVAPTGTFYRNPEMNSLPIGIDGIPEGWTVIPPYDDDNGGDEPTDNASEYLTFEAIEDGTFSFSQNAVQYSMDGTTWNDLAADSSTPMVNAGSKIHFKAANPSITSSAGIGTFKSTGRFNVSGNIMSMLYGDEFVGKNNLAGKDYAFRNLFSNCDGLVDASELILPATTLAYKCYYDMFGGCNNLTSAPALSATTLASYCYSFMFSNCTSLTKTPSVLPATTLADWCYYCMFSGCTSLTSAPALPAMALVSYCYYNMFWSCTSLTSAPELPATTLAEHCYESMFSNCASLTTAPELPATTLANECYSGMFFGCTSLTTAPELPATTLAISCYNGMFYNCTSLTAAPALPVTTLVSTCYLNMFNGCSNLNEITMLATDISANNCLLNWVEGVAPIGTFYRNSEMTSLPIGVNGIPEGWIIIPPYNDDNDGDGDNGGDETIGDANEYLTFEAIEDGKFSFSQNTARYSMDGVTWYGLAVDAPTPTVSAGSKIHFKATNPSITEEYGIGTFSSTGKFNISGNIMSMLYGNNFRGETDLTGKDYAFRNLFSNCAGLVDASELILPAATLTKYCYLHMFNGCTSLTTAPSVLPATTLAYGCYWGMFWDCTSLTSAPELPATTLAEHCYNTMFQYCGNLATAPALPATTLTNWCYYKMFDYCSKLNNITMLATDISATDCLSGWVRWVASTGTFYRNPEMNSLPFGINGIPKDWTIIPPYNEEYLTFEAIEDGTFSFSKNTIQYSMDGTTWNDLEVGASTPTVSAGSKIHFKAKVPTTEYGFVIGTFSSTGNFNVSGNIMSMVYGDNFVGETDLTGRDDVFMDLFENSKVVDASALVLPAAKLSFQCYAMMFENCKSLTSAPALPATTLSGNCYLGMFRGCTSLTTAPALPATAMRSECYTEMFRNCTRLTTAPELPASVLEDECYKLMFYDCAKLKEIKMYATDITATGCLSGWVERVASTGTFYRNPEMNSLPIGINGIPEGWTIIPPYGDDNGGDEPTGNANEYLTFEAIEDGAFSFTRNAIQYSVDGTTWNDLTADSSTPTVNAGSKIYFKATNPSVSNIYGIGTFSSTGRFNVSGNVMSMLYGDDFIGKTDLTNKSYAFKILFQNCAGLVDASELILPATTLAVECYRNMFDACTSLTTAPALPVTTLAESCYRSMFKGCTSLTSAPELPATTLTKYCYMSMFEGCANMTSAPSILPAATMKYHCYNNMFKGCTSLTTAPALPSTTLTTDCYYGMFQDCTSLVSAPELPATTLANECYYGMFQGCTSLVSAPELPATTLKEGCYYGMFNGCSNLSEITMLATDISATNCLSSWVKGVPSTGTFYRNPEMNSLLISSNGIPKGWTIIPPYDANEYLTFEAIEDGAFSFSQNTIQYSMDGITWNDLAVGTSLPTVSAGSKIHFKATNPSITEENGIGTFSSTGEFNISGNIMSMLYGDDFIGKTDLTGKDYAFKNLFKNCSRLFVSHLSLPATTLANNCYQSMFSGCWSLASAPELPATTLAQGCYSYMFKGCTNLTTAPTLPATTLAEYCYDSMFQSCKNLTSAPELPATALANRCYYEMFYDCGKLKKIKMYATDISASKCLENWVSGVASTGIFYRNPEMTSLPTGASGIPEGWTIIPPYDGDNGGDEPTGNANEYLTFEAIEDSTFSFNQNTIQYSMDGTTWNDLAVDTSTPMVNAGNKIYFKAINPSITEEYGIGTFSSTGRFDISGNIMSMLYGDDFAGQTDLIDKDCAFSNLFKNCAGLVGASELILPAAILAYRCYWSMFQGCTSLTSAPELPATTLGRSCYYEMFSGCINLATAPALPAETLAHWCYSNMFKGCTSLTTAPELPATTLAQNCYSYMFQGCTSLTSAPELPATKLEFYCYQYMFNGCINLATAPVLPATTLNDYCYSDMFRDCTSLTTAPELPATTLAHKCYSNMFQGCTSLTSAPELPATIVAERCYYGMFRDCTSLTTAPELPATTLDNYCYYEMFNGCTSLTTAPELPATTLIEYCYMGMFQGCTSLTSAPALPATTLADMCYQSMFNGCTSLTTAPELPVTTLTEACYSNMFRNCTSLTSAPSLPATKLYSHCYYHMFQGCSNLSEITMLATDISTSDCLDKWVEGVASTGTFVKHSNMNSLPTGNSGIPEGWTILDYNG